MLEIAQKNVRLLLFLSLPCTVGLFVLSRPIIEVIYMRGAFTQIDVEATAMVLQTYSLLLVFAGFHRVTVPSFYAVKNTWIPAFTSIVSLILHVFIASWAVKNYGLQGLIAATTFTAFLNLTMLLIAYKWIFGRIGFGALLKTVAHMAPSLVVIAFFSPFAFAFLEGSIGRLFALTVAIGSAVGLFLIVNSLLGHPELKAATQVLNRRLQRK